MSDSTPTAPIAIIADDEDLGRLLLAETAAASGLMPLAFDNGLAALHAALSQPVAIVLLDVDMPGMDGYAVCRRLRAEPCFATVPVVMVTGHEDAAAISRAFDAGATDFISKPVNWDLLPRRLAYIRRNAAAAERIERLAYFDTLTGLPNRPLCMDTADRMFAEAAGARQQAAVIYLDLAGFRRINDTFGHSVGDAVLQLFATKLAQVVDSFRARLDHVFLARFSTEEFVIMARDADARSLAADIAAACFAALREPIVYDKLEFYSAPSVGVAIYPDDGADVETVIKHADTAMHQAKESAAGLVVAYSAAMSSRLRDWHDLDARLRRAIHEGQLYLRYQPKFRLRDNRIVGAEALLRWREPEHGEIPPTRFIEIAEDSGLIIELGAWVIRAVCRQIRDWRDRGVNLPVAVNVSGKELLHADPVRILLTEAAAAGIPVSLIEVEITESLLVGDSAKVRGALETLRGLGCRIALDDFGTGYSSLAYITRFPPDRIKIDKAFIRNVDRSAGDGAVATAILSLAEGLGITVTAEGVETSGQLDWLRARRCHEVQGYLLSEPLAVGDLEDRLLRDSLAEAIA